MYRPIWIIIIKIIIQPLLKLCDTLVGVITKIYITVKNDTATVKNDTVTVNNGTFTVNNDTVLLIMVLLLLEIIL